MVDNIIHHLTYLKNEDKKRTAEALAERRTFAIFKAVNVGLGADGANDRLTKKEIGDAIKIAEDAKDANNQVVVDLLYATYDQLVEGSYYTKAQILEYYTDGYYKHPTEENQAHAETVIEALIEYKTTKDANDEKKAQDRMKAATFASSLLTEAIFQASDTEEDGEMTYNELMGLFQNVIIAGVDHLFADQLRTHIMAQKINLSLASVFSD